MLKVILDLNALHVHQGIILPCFLDVFRVSAILQEPLEDLLLVFLMDHAFVNQHLDILDLNVLIVVVDPTRLETLAMVGKLLPLIATNFTNTF